MSVALTERASAQRVPGLLLLALLAQAAAAAGAQAPRFVRLTPDDGLSKNTVEAIVRDERGFLWLGTPDGLNRYDGSTFAVYRNDPEDPQSLSNNSVLALLEDREGTLWVGTAYGLNRYRRDTDSFVRYLSDEGDGTSLSNDVVHAIHEDRGGDLWIGTYWGLNRFQRASGTFVRYLPDEERPERGPSLPHVRAILEDRRGGLWISTEGGGLNRFDRHSATFTHYLHRSDDPKSLSHNDVRDVIEDRGGTLWIATHGGLNRFEPLTKTFDAYVHDADDPQSLGNDHVDALFEDGEGILWIGTDGGGLEIFDRASETFFHVRHDPSDETSLGSNAVRTIYEDSLGDLWIGAYTGGVNFYNRSTVAIRHTRHVPNRSGSLSHSGVLSFHEDEDGTLWVGTEGGLNRLDPGTESFRTYRHDEKDPRSLASDVVLSILRDRRGHLWVGTFFGGLSRLDPQSDTFVRFQPDPGNPKSLGNPHVWDVFEDRAGRLWLATFGGVDRFEYETATFVHYPNDPADETTVGNNVVWNLYQDSGGTLWLATQGGLSVYRSEQDNFRTYRHDPEDGRSLSSNQVLSILEDRSGRLWVGTDGAGLNLFDRETETWTALRGADGLPNEIVYGLLEDERGFLWLSTNAGLSRLDPETSTLTNYDKSDGFLAGPFSKNSYLLSQSGDMLFGGVNGFNRFDPQSIEDNPHLPPIVLTGFEIFNEKVPIGGKSPLQQNITEAERVRLRHDQSVLTFTFAALSFRAPEKNRFAYMLESFDDDWTYADTKRSATYTNLDPGTYVFRVKGSNNSGLWNEEGTSITIEVLPPWWGTWWFRGLFLLALVGLLAGGYQVQTRSIRGRNLALRAEIEERRLLETEREGLMRQLAEQNAELEAKNAELERFTYTVSHDLKTPLVTIRGFLGLLEKDALAGDIDLLKKDIGFVDTAVDRMQRLLEELLALSHVGRVVNPPEATPLSELAREAAELVAGKIEERGVTVTIDEEMPVVLVDRVRFREVYQNLMENAVKFLGDEPEPRIEVGARINGMEVVCYVRDNGIGIDPKYHDKVFGLFERLEADAEGTGIGLALVKRIVEVHGGDVWVESEGAGRGSAFCFTLFLANDPSAEEKFRESETNEA